MCLAVIDAYLFIFHDFNLFIYLYVCICVCVYVCVCVCVCVCRSCWEQNKERVYWLPKDISSTSHPHPIHITSTSHPHLIDISFTSHPHLIHILPLVLGDTVNLSARLMSKSKTLGGGILTDFETKVMSPHHLHIIFTPSSHHLDIILTSS